jgi:septum formation topological specificity factor MinE
MTADRRQQLAADLRRALLAVLIEHGSIDPSISVKTQFGERQFLVAVAAIVPIRDGRPTS